MSSNAILEKLNWAKYQIIWYSAPVMWIGLTVWTGWVTLDSADVTNVSNTAGSYLTTIFQSTQFLPTIWLIAGWLYLLNKVFGVVKFGGSK